MRIEKVTLANQFDPSRLVTSHDIFSKKSISVTVDGQLLEQKKFNDAGLFSARIFGDIDSQEEYSCECGHQHGKFYEGSVCPKCNTEVKYVGLSIEKCGWIDLSLNKYNEDGTIQEVGNGTHIIKYIAYSQLEKIIGRDNLKKIINVLNVITVTGDIDTEGLDAIRSQSPEAKYWHIGIDEFYDKYTEVLNYYYNLKPEKYTELYKFLQNRDEVFTDKIPVIPIVLRPARRVAGGMKLDDINLKYQNILKNLGILRDPIIMKIIRDTTVEEIQAEFMLLSEAILESIKGKNGIIRNQICGTRINFSARNIISPAKAGYKIDEIVLPYMTFIELYKFEIINTIKITENKTIKEAEAEWYNATLKYDEKIWKIMKKMVSENEVGVLLNRNPTISYGSILYLRVADVKKDFSDMTMSIHNCILTCLAGDYDKPRTLRMQLLFFL